MLASVGWGLLFLAGTLQMWHAVVLLVIHGVAGVVGAPATQLMVHDMVPAENLPSAIRLTASSRYLSILLGPAVGGGLMLLLGPAWGLLTNVLIRQVEAGEARRAQPVMRERSCMSVPTRVELIVHD